MISAEIVLASENAATGDRLYTFLLTYPRCLLAEINTHRAFSRNTASSRAVPAKKMRSMVWNDPWVPKYIGRNKPGMQAGRDFDGFALTVRQAVYKYARIPALVAHWLLEKLGVHKQIVNRLIEPWLWVQQLVSATDLNNFFNLRCSEFAEPHVNELSCKMRDAVNHALVQKIEPGQVHLPFGKWNGSEADKKVSTARCARVSYYLESYGESDLIKDLKLHNQLSSSGHWSPFEHVAVAMNTSERIGNFKGWKQYRYEFEDQAGGD